MCSYCGMMGAWYETGSFADLVQEKQIEEQLLGCRRRTENEGGEAKEMVVEHGGMRLAKVWTPMGMRGHGLGAAKLREPSPLSGLRF